MYCDLMLNVVGAVRERPAENRTVGADADDVTLVRADLDAGDRGAVSKSDVRHRAFLVQPNLLATSTHASSSSASSLSSSSTAIDIICFIMSLAENAQYDLFRNSCSTDHCLNHLYTANRKPAGSMQLRHRGHNFALPTIHLEFNKRHFIARVLFDYV